MAGVQEERLGIGISLEMAQIRPPPHGFGVQGI